MAPQNTSLEVSEEVKVVESVGGVLVTSRGTDIAASAHLPTYDPSCPSPTPLPPTAPHTYKSSAATPSAEEDRVTACLVDDEGKEGGVSRLFSHSVHSFSC